MLRRVALAFILLASCLLQAKDKKDRGLSDAELVAITQRGRMMAEYDVASWHATDVIQDLKPAEGSTRYYIAKKTEAGWVVVFGRFNDTHDRFLIVYQATQGTRPDFFTAKKFDPPLESTDFYFAAAKGFEIALKDFGGATRPYNVYALPSETGQLYVYLLPAQTQDGIYPLGGDVRYSFTADGNTIIEKRQMHKTIIENNLNEPKIKKIEAGSHTHVLSNVPEDSDVFYVLTRKPSVPEYVGMLDKKIYIIQADGTIVLRK